MPLFSRSGSGISTPFTTQARLVTGDGGFNPQISPTQCKGKYDLVTEWATACGDDSICLWTIEKHV